MKKVHVVWQSETEDLIAEFDHAMLVVPEGEDHHRVYFVAGGPDAREGLRNLGKMTAVVIDMALRNGGGAPIRVATRILSGADPGSFRGPSEPHHPLNDPFEATDL